MRGFCQAALAAVLLSGVAVSTQATEMKLLRPGQWEITRHGVKIGDQARDIKFTRCTDPIATHEQQKRVLAAAGQCKYEAPVHSGNTLTYKGQCMVGGVTTTYQSVFTLEGDSRYVLRETATTPKEPQRSTHLSGTRIGDC